MKKIGFIGMGNMAKALAVGFIKSGKVKAEDMFAYAPNQAKLAANGAEVGFTPCASVKELVGASDVVIMACKPYQIEGVLKEVGDDLAGKMLVSVAISWDYQRYQPLLREDVHFQYILPNTPCQVGEGVFLMEINHSLTEEQWNWFHDLLEGCGTVVKLPGHLIDAGSAVAGCGPAFISMMMEAMGDAAVKHGIPRAEAYKLVGQMVTGTGKMMLETGKHPAVLKDEVCSPGGTTIRGVSALEHAGMRAAFIDAVDAATGKDPRW